MNPWIRAHWPVVLCLLALSVAMGVLWGLSLSENEGHFVYALDDAYIHMAIAKNFVQEGVWGLTKEHFTSSSSSLLWVLLLSVVYAVFGVFEMAPYFLNFLFAVLLVLAVYWLMRRDRRNTIYIFACVLVVAFATPLPALIVGGMEHVLQVLVSILFVYFSSIVLSGENEHSQKQSLRYLLVLTPLVPLTRYEGLFIVAVVCFLFAIRRQWSRAFLLGFLALTPIAVYGLVSKLHGWFWLPNSILLKGHFPQLTSVSQVLFFFDSTMLSFLRAPLPVFYLFASSVLLYVIRMRLGKAFWEAKQLAIIIFLSVTYLHMQFSAAGWFYRYEAYLVALGMVVVFMAIGDIFTNWKELITPKGRLGLIIIALALFALFPARVLVLRALEALDVTIMAQNDRLLEHIYPAKFVSTYYDYQTIVANDLGAVTFYTHARVLDMYGLGNVEPILFRQKKTGYTDADVFQWTAQQKAKIAILQVEWNEIYPRLPDKWIKIGEWTLPRNVIFGDKRIGFFALDPKEAQPLADNLREFSSTVPPQIKKKITTVY